MLGTFPYGKIQSLLKEEFRRNGILVKEIDPKYTSMTKLIENNFISVRQGDDISKLIQAIEISHRNIFPVLDKNDKFLGVIHLDNVRNIIFKPELYNKYLVEDLMSTLSEGDIVHIEEPLSDVVYKFQMGHDRYNLVVLDKNDNYVGFLSRANTFSAYRRFVSASSEE